MNIMLMAWFLIVFGLPLFAVFLLFHTVTHGIYLYNIHILHTTCPGGIQDWTGVGTLGNPDGLVFLYGGCLWPVE